MIAVKPAAPSWMSIASWSPEFVNRSVAALGVNVASVAASGEGGACGIPLFVTNAKFAGSSPTLRAAVRVVQRSRVRILQQAEDRHGRTPLGRVAADPRRPADPAGRIELELQERRSRMLADVVRDARIRPVEDVRVAVGRARRVRELRRRLVVAERDPDPEGDVELEVPCARRAGLVRQHARIARQPQVV
jgi:hypothetical protein